MKLNRKNKKGFTIVELVIVIAVIGILAAILIPTFTNLTKNAQETAKKQQVSDAYTLYLSEAVDGKYDNLYTRTGTSAPYTYTKYEGVALTNKQQAQVALNLKGEWFQYDQEKGWNAYTPDSAPTTLVCNHYSAAFTADLKLYDSDGNEKFSFTTSTTVGEANLALSTFNGVAVYVK